LKLMESEFHHIKDRTRVLAGKNDLSLPLEPQT